MTQAPPKIIDATLREGAQTPGVRFDAAASARIGAAVGRLGVDMIECGHPAIGAAERDRIAAVADSVETPLLVHARANLDDIRHAAETGAAWVGVFIGVNRISRDARLSPRVAGALPRHISAAVAEAKARGLSVRFTVEDASRTEKGPLLDAVACALDAGADRICWADTVGIAKPAEVAAAVRTLRAAAPGTPIELHLHNDRGLALASALAGLEAGAEWIAATVNGIGERCGIVDTLQFLINLRFEGAQRRYPDGALIADARETVALAAGMAVPPQNPCTGALAFTHESRLHRLAAARDPKSYEGIAPDWVGAKAG